MKKLVLQKVVTLIAALALGSACIANDALARGGGGGGGMGGGGFGGHGGGGFGGNGGGGDHIGGGFAGGHMGGFPGGRMGGDFHAGLRDDHELGRISTPFFYGNYWDNAQGFACWKSQRIPTNAAWRLRQAGNMNAINRQCGRSGNQSVALSATQTGLPQLSCCTVAARELPGWRLGSPPLLVDPFHYSESPAI